jgi:DNA-binding Lrp family transcriptional regulator
LKDVELKLISELMKNSHRSDRELAKVIGTSQPTVTRTRQRLEKEGVIKEYTMIPDFNKLGIEFLAFTFGVWSLEMLKDHPENARMEKAKNFISKHPNVFFASSGRGLGMGRLIVTFHKGYSDYIEFMKQAESEWAGLLTRLESFTISLKTDAVLMPFSFRDLMGYVTKPE